MDGASGNGGWGQCGRASNTAGSTQEQKCVVGFPTFLHVVGERVGGGCGSGFELNRVCDLQTAAAADLLPPPPIALLQSFSHTSPRPSLQPESKKLALHVFA